MAEQPTRTKPVAITEEQLAAWLRERCGGTIYETDDAADLLHGAFVFTRADGLVVPRHTLGWTLPAASLVGPYPRAVEAAARLCRDYVVTAVDPGA